MLQATIPLTTNPLTTETDTAQGSIRELINWAIGILRRQFLIVAFCTLLATSLAAIHVFMAPATYTAEATILIDPRRLQLFQGATFAESQIDSPSALESQIELVKSEPVALSVIRDLRLAEDPEFVGSKGGSEGLLGFVSRFFSSNKQSEAFSEVEATTAALGVLSRNLTVNRAGISNILNIKYRSLRPTRAVEIANAIAEAYIVEQREAKSQSTRRATDWLQGRIEELNQKRALADRAVLDFKQEHNMISADGKLMNEQQVWDLNSQVAAARKQTSEAKARLDRIDAVIRDDALDTKTNATVADTLNSSIITQLRTRYLEFVAREANWSRKYGANHLAVVNLRNQIRDLRGSILDELKRLRETYVSNYEISKQQEQDLEKGLAEAVSQFRTIHKAQVAVRELESSAQSLRTMHDIFLQRYTESLQQQSFPISEARIFQLASRPSVASGRKAALILLVSVAGGLGIGMAVGAFRELMNGSFFTREQVESAVQTACISVVPLVKSDSPTLSRSSRPMLPFDQSLGAGLNNQRTISRDPDVFWDILTSPLSHFAEAIRSIKLAIDLKSGDVNSNKVIGFTSSLPNEGKSTIASSVALLMAQAGARVILVDCDLRNPSLSRRLAPNAGHGILDVLAGRMILEDVVWTDQSTNLMLLPNATKTRVIHSSDILAADATRELFENLQSMYDYVVVDLPPLMPVQDTRATTGFVHSYVCVVEWGRTKIAAVKYGFKDAHNISENLLGIVLNKADINRLNSYYPIGESYYRRKYYSQYGITE